MPSVRSKVIEIAAPVSNKPEPGKIYLVGQATHDEVIKIPDGYGTTDDYFLMLSLPIAGIPEDSHFGDNGFSGYLARADQLSDRTGWRIRAISADNLERGATGGMNSVQVRTTNVPVHYAAVRIT